MKKICTVEKVFFNKKNYKALKIVLSLFFSLIISYGLEKFIFEKFVYTYFSFDRMIILSILVCLLFLYFLIDIKEKLELLYKYRYAISFLLLLIIVICGYSGSSINMYNIEIQQEVKDAKYEEIFGKSRGIRSDEWAVNTPLAFSQRLLDKRFNYFSEKLRATSTDMFSVINAPVLDIVSIGKPFNIGYLISNKIGLSFWWCGRLISLMLISFELGMILTKNNKKISLIGMLLIVYSPAVQWWYSNFIVDILIWGSLIIVLTNKFMLTKNIKIKVACLVGIAISAVSYIFTFYPAWIISFGYVYLALFIWVILKNKNQYLINKKDIVGMIAVIIFIAIIGIRFYLKSSDALKINLQTDYPGDRFVIGGEKNAKANLFSYLYSILMPFKFDLNPCEKSSMLSYYPIPLILAIMLLYKDKKYRNNNYLFLIPMFFVVALLSIWTFFETNRIFAKITLLYMVPCNRGIIPLGFSQILLFVYVIGNISEGTILFNKKQSLILSIVAVTIILLILLCNMPEIFKEYLKIKFIFIILIMNVLVFYLILSYNNKEIHNRLLCCLLIIISLLSGLFVNPMIKGINVIYDKPLAKQVQSIVTEEKDAIWITEGLNFTKSNYLIANGARVINCTNYYPNFKLLRDILGDEEFNNEENKKVYNRYSHIFFKITNEDTKLNLITLDTIEVNINTDDLEKMNIKYILSENDLEMFNTSELSFNKIYDELGLCIYELVYNGINE